MMKQQQNGPAASDQQVTEMSEKLIDPQKVAYVEGILSNIDYYRRQVIHFESRVRMMNEELEKEKITGGIHSPGIMSPEEAKYQKGTPIYKNKVEELIGEIAACEQNAKWFQSTIDRYNSFMMSLEPIEHDMVFMKFEKGLYYEDIAEQFFLSRETVRKTIRKALMKWK